MRFGIRSAALAQVIVFCMAFAWPQTAEGTAKSITVEDAVKAALRTHVDIRRSELSLKASSREKNHSWNSVLPSLSVTGTGAERKYYKDSSTDTVSAYAGAGASLTIDTGLAAKIKEIQSEYESAKLSYDDTVQSVECSVRESFYNLLYLKQKLEVSRTTLDSYQRQYDQTKKKFDKGVAPELDLLSAQVNLEATRPDVDSALSSYTTALHEFTDTIGIDFDGNMELSGSLDYAETAGTISPAVLDGCVEKSPDIKKLEASLKTAEYARASSFGSSMLPSLTASASVYPEYYSYEKTGSTSSDTPYWSASLSVSLPVDSWVPGSSAQDKIASLNDTVNDYKLQIEDKKKSVLTSAVEKLHKIELSQKTLTARHLNVDLAEKSYQMTEDAYQRGTKDLLTLQSALDSLHSAELELRTEQYNLICNVFDLEKALGLPMTSFFTTAQEAAK